MGPRAPHVRLTGTSLVASNDVTLTAGSLPPNTFGFFLTSQTHGSTPNPGGSQGVLCLSGDIGRFVGPGQIMNTGASGTFSLALDLTSMPTPSGLVPAAAGETWNFQAWYRDVNPTTTSNVTDAVAVTFH